jgi:hypothetical protein
VKRTPKAEVFSARKRSSVTVLSVFPAGDGDHSFAFLTVRGITNSWDAINSRHTRNIRTAVGTLAKYKEVLATEGMPNSSEGRNCKQAATERQKRQHQSPHNSRNASNSMEATGQKLQGGKQKRTPEISEYQQQ